MQRKWVLILVALGLLGSPSAARADGCPLDAATARARDTALNENDSTAALSAAQAYLEGVNALGKKNPSCFDYMESDVPKLRQLHCAVDTPKKEDATCVVLDKVQMDITRLAAQLAVEKADKGEGDVSALYERGGQLYLAIFREHCQEPLAFKRPIHAAPHHCEEVAYNAARAFAGGHLMGRAIVSYRSLVAYGQKTKSSSPLPAKAMYELGGLYQSMALFDYAVEWYERYATENPRDHYAISAMSDAAVLRLGLGQPDSAMRNATLMMKNWGYTRRPETAQLVLTIASHHVEKKELPKARSILTGAMEMLDRGPPDLQVRAHTLLAQASPQNAKEEYAKVRALWRDPQAMELAIRRGWPMEDQMLTDRRLARTLNAVGEATFAAAEERRIADVEPLKFPVYTGAADRASVLAHVQTAVKDWSVKKMAAIERAEREYVKVLELRPVPPPKWVIGAAATVGLMWGDYVDDFRRAPVPDTVRRDRALAKAYSDAIEAVSDAMLTQRAKPAMHKCIDLSVKYQFVDTRARSCEAWLAKHSKKDFHLVDEILPGLMEMGRPAEMTPLTYEGEPRRF